MRIAKVTERELRLQCQYGLIKDLPIFTAESKQKFPNYYHRKGTNRRISDDPRCIIPSVYMMIVDNRRRGTQSVISGISGERTGTINTAKQMVQSVKWYLLCVFVAISSFQNTLMPRWTPFGVF